MDKPSLKELVEIIQSPKYQRQLADSTKQRAEQKEKEDIEKRRMDYVARAKSQGFSDAQAEWLWKDRLEIVKMIDQVYEMTRKL